MPGGAPGEAVSGAPRRVGMAAGGDRCGPAGGTTDTAAPAAAVPEGGGGRVCVEAGGLVILIFLGRCAFLWETSVGGRGLVGRTPSLPGADSPPGARCPAPLGGTAPGRCRGSRDHSPASLPQRPAGAARLVVARGGLFPSLCPSPCPPLPGPWLLQCGGCGYARSTSQPRTAAVAAPQIPRPPPHGPGRHEGSPSPPAGVGAAGPGLLRPALPEPRGRGIARGVA